MIARLIAWSAKNLMLVFIATEPLHLANGAPPRGPGVDVGDLRPDAIQRRSDPPMRHQFELADTHLALPPRLKDKRASTHGNGTASE